jgi:hypothetical protein
VPQIWEQSAAVLVTAANPEHGPLAASLLKQQGKNLFIWGMASPACRAFLRLLSAHLDPEQNGWGAAYYSAGLLLAWAASVVILAGYGVMPSADVYRLISASRGYGPYSRAKFGKPVADWVRENCKLVEPAQWRATTMRGNAELFDLSGPASLRE